MKTIIANPYRIWPGCDCSQCEAARKELHNLLAENGCTAIAVTDEYIVMPLPPDIALRPEHV